MATPHVLPQPSELQQRHIAWAVLAGGFLVTAVASQFMIASVRKIAERDFFSHTEELKIFVSKRLDDHARILLGGAAFFQASAEVTRETWRVFTSHQQVEKQLPGIQGMGYSPLIPRPELARHLQNIRGEGFPEYTVKPEGERDFYTPVIYLEPFSGRNLRAFGYDMFSEPVRRAAMERARDTDAPALSGKVFLVQETDQDVQPGTLMYVPVYRKGQPIDSVERRRAAITGWVYSPYRMNDLIQGILGDRNLEQKKQLYLTVYDGDSLSPQSLLYGGPSAEKKCRESATRFTRQIPVDFNGNRWTLCFAQTGDGVLTADYLRVWLTLVGGLLITALLFALIRALLSTRAEAQRMAVELTANLQESEQSYRNQFALNSAVMLLIDAGDGAIIDANDAALDYYGYPRKRMLALHITDINVLAPLEVRHLMATVGQEKSKRFQFQHRLANGSIRDVEVSSSRIPFGGRAVLHSIIQDNTDLKKAERALQSKTALLEAKLNATLDGVLVIDANQKRLLINQHMIDLFNIPQPVLQDDDDTALLAYVTNLTKNPEQFLEKVQHLYGQTAEVSRDDIELKNGMLLDRYSAPVFGEDGTYFGRIWTFRDITERKRTEDDSKRQAALINSLLDSIPDIIFFKDVNGVYLGCNPAFAEFVGRSKEWFIGKTDYDLFDREIADSFRTNDRLMLDSCEARHNEESVTYPDGRIRIIDTLKTPYWGPDGKLIGILGISRDITERRQAEDALRKSEEQVSLLLNSTAEAIYGIDLQGDCTFANPACVRMLGYADTEQLLGKNMHALIHYAYPGGRPMPVEVCRIYQAFREGKDVHVDDEVLWKADGTSFPAEYWSYPVSVKGAVTGSVVTFIDITKRKIAEMELARLSVIQSELMRLATDFVNVPLERQDRAIDQSLATMGQLIHADRAYLFAYDFGAGRMSNTHEWCEAGITTEIENRQAIPAERLPDWVAAHRRGELMHIPNVEALPANSALRLMLEPQGIRSLITLPLMQGAACLGFVGFDSVREERVWHGEEVSILRVLAELYAHFEARRASERETLELQKSLMEARDAAQSAALAKSMFLANMSHEIRTPLNAILGYAQIMGRECQACPMGHRLKAITRSGEHLLELLTDLQELVRSDTHNITLAPSAFDLYQALDDVRIMFARNPAAQTLTLEVAHAPNVPRFICADPGKVRQILVNLVGNAFKFTVMGGVRLSASVLATDATDGVTLAVDVEDTGCGIAIDDMGRIFKVFEQTESSRKSGKGTGLGLHLSQRYARALGGDITVTSRLGEGSCFRFTFRAQVAPDDATEQPRRGSVRRLAEAQRAYRVLVVDDDPSSREILAALLEPVGFTVETVDSPVRALARLDTAETVDLVLIDKQMPEMDGYEAIRRIRQLAGKQKLPVLVVTASGFSDERKRALAAGANGLVSKPVRREQLLEEIGRAVSAQYAYDEAEAATDVAQLDSDALARLPAQQLRVLDQAVRRGDILMLRTIVATIALDHAGLAAGIRTLVDTYNYDHLRRLLDATKMETV